MTRDGIRISERGRPANIEAQLAALPQRPGVYLLRDESGEILYVGKAKSLRTRVRSYFRRPAEQSLKLRELRRRTWRIESFAVASEAEALLLESNLIKEHQPRFNIQLRDDKTYPYIKVTLQETFPRVLVTRHLRPDGSRYFGPFTDVKAMRRALRLIKRTYTVRSCHYDLPVVSPDRPCLDYHIGRCKAPCVGLQSAQDYGRMIKEILAILSGRTGPLRASVRQRMRDASERLEFEKAGELQAVLRGLDAIERRQTTIDFRGGDRDVLGLAREDRLGCGVLLRVREGRLLGRQVHHFLLPEDETLESLAEAATKALTLHLEELPAELLVPLDFEDRLAVQELLSERRGKKVAVLIPQRGRKHQLIELANANARHVLEERLAVRAQAAAASSQDSAESPVCPPPALELQAKLGLSEPPRHLVCFDISTLGGSDSVGSLVWLTDGQPVKREYRRFRIRETHREQPDDYAMMQEVVGRYFLRRVREEKSMPDLVIVDGGKGQLSAAVHAMETAGVSDLQIVGLAKRDEEIFLPGHREPVKLRRSNQALHWLQRARDEAHRSALSYNRRLRKRRTLRSSLGEIAGIGPARETELLRRFGSAKAIASLSEATLSEVPGIGRATAGRILDGLRTLAGKE